MDNQEKPETTIIPEQVALMINAKRLLSSITEKERNADYKSIMEKITHFLLQYCNHDFIEDLIDLSPDESQKICYCLICEEMQLADD